MGLKAKRKIGEPSEPSAVWGRERKNPLALADSFRPKPHLEACGGGREKRRRWVKAVLDWQEGGGGANFFKQLLGGHHF